MKPQTSQALHDARCIESGVMESEATAKSDFYHTSADEESSATGLIAEASTTAELNDATTNDEDSPDKRRTDKNSTYVAQIPASNGFNDALMHGSFGISVHAAQSPVADECDPQPAEYNCADEEKAASGTESSTGVGYVNLGLENWEKNREKWLKRAGDAPKTEKHAIPINVDAIIDAVFSTPQKMRATGGIGDKFPQSVPLPQMVDILQDLWEAESL
jgi:hypothetical protein